MKRKVLQASFVPHKFHARNVDFEPAVDISRQYIEEIIIEERLHNGRAGTVRSEAYTIQILEDGSSIIKTTSPQGGLHALETFAQLFFGHSVAMAGPYTPCAPLLIEDSPAFEHRGLNLDISRNWIPPSDVMRTIEAMAANKLNKLHIHASDAQSWPLEIPALPDLANKGAYSRSQFWAAKDLEAVQRHGKAHGIEVFVEIDLPGHTTSIGNAYPDLVTAKGAKWSDYAVEPPCGQLRLNSTLVPPFIDTLLHDLLARTSQHSSHFHLGGDELNLNAYLLDPTVRSSSPTVLQPLLQTFIDRVISLASSYDLTTILWEEMLLDWNLTLPASTIVQTWRPSDNDDDDDTALAAILAKGHRTLFGSNTHWYLDCGLGHFLDPDPANPLTPVKSPYLDYCSPYKNWRHIYSYNPISHIAPHLHHLLIGGEAHLWGELTDSVTLDSMLWPRLSAAAEVMWSGPGRTPDEDTTRRLADMMERLVASGVGAGVVQMEWCLRNRGGCRL